MAAGAAWVGAAGEATQGLEVVLREGEVLGGSSGVSGEGLGTAQA